MIDLNDDNHVMWCDLFLWKIALHAVHVFAHHWFIYLCAFWFSARHFLLACRSSSIVRAHPPCTKMDFWLMVFCVLNMLIVFFSSIFCMCVGSMCVPKMRTGSEFSFSIDLPSGFKKETPMHSMCRVCVQQCLVIGKIGENRQNWGKLKLNVRYEEKINFVDMILFFSYPRNSVWNARLSWA